MFLSIIIPHYDLPEELLRRCIDSIVEQETTTFDYEIIVVDDGSATPPVWIKEQYHGITLIESTHQGLGAARNQGLDIAKGEYALFVDSDDYLAPDSLKQCFSIINDEHPEILRFKFSKDAKREIAKKTKYGKTISGAAFMSSHNLPGSACLYIFSRKLVERLKLRFKCGIYHEDEEFTTRLHYHALSLIDSNITAYIYDTRPGSITQSNDHQVTRKRINDYLTVLGDIRTFNNESRAGANPMQRKGLERKQAFLTVDVIMTLLGLGKSAKEIYTLCTGILHDIGLYPLPQAPYSIKYRIFRLLANSKCGMGALRLLIPSRKPAKQ